VLAELIQVHTEHKRPVSYETSFGSDFMDLGPGRITILGGGPGDGKTSLAMACLFDALAARPDLRAAVANTEIPEMELLERELARRSGIPFQVIHRQTYTPEQEKKLHMEWKGLVPHADRIDFLPPAVFTPDGIEQSVRGSGAKLLVLDYIQDIYRPDRLTAKEAVEEVLRSVKRLAREGVCTIIVSQVSRSAVGGLGGQLKETGQLDYDGDTILVFDKPKARPKAKTKAADLVEERVLRHRKNRRGPRQILKLGFEVELHRWTLAGVVA
jgi:replicative DNA helicase